MCNGGADLGGDWSRLDDNNFGFQKAVCGLAILSILVQTINFNNGIGGVFDNCKGSNNGSDRVANL